MYTFISLALIAVITLSAPFVPLPLGPGPQAAQNQEEIKPVDINTATVEELQAVPGIGEVLARRIVAFRDEHGPFEKVDDLLNVRGIGVTSLEKLRPLLVVKKGG